MKAECCEVHGMLSPSTDKCETFFDEAVKLRIENKLMKKKNLRKEADEKDSSSVQPLKSF